MEGSRESPFEVWELGWGGLEEWGEVLGRLHRPGGVQQACALSAWAKPLLQHCPGHYARGLRAGGCCAVGRTPSQLKGQDTRRQSLTRAHSSSVHNDLMSSRGEVEYFRSPLVRYSAKDGHPMHHRHTQAKLHTNSLTYK